MVSIVVPSISGNCGKENNDAILLGSTRSTECDLSSFIHLTTFERSPEMDMDRETYLMGRAALKQKIKALSFEQTRAKVCLRVIRKMLSTPEQGAVALKVGGYKGGEDVPKHWTCQCRRTEISAYLNVYAKIRGKEPQHGSKKHYLGMYSQYFEQAQVMFDEAASTAVIA